MSDKGAQGRPEIIEVAVLRGMTEGLSVDDCRALSAAEAVEVAKRLIAVSQRARGIAP